LKLEFVGAFRSILSQKLKTIEEIRQQTTESSIINQLKE